MRQKVLTPGPSHPDATSSRPSTIDRLTGSPDPPFVLPAQDELVAVTDFSSVEYATVGEGYPAVPGAPTPTSTRHQDPWLRRTSTLPPELLVETVRDLDARRADVVTALGDEPTGVLWPETAGEGRSTEYVVPQPDGRFLVQRGQHDERPRTLALALLSGEPNSGEPPLDDFDRLELVRLLALLMDRLHSAEIVCGHLRWDTFLFTVAPRPAVVIHRPESLRRLGGEYLALPEDDGSPLASGSAMDTDRHHFAEITHGLLVSGDVHAPVDPRLDRQLPGLTADQTRQMQRLWERAIGEPGTRPQVAEWRTVLGV